MIPEFMPEAGDVIEIINNARMSRDFHSKTKKKKKKKNDTKVVREEYF